MRPCSKEDLDELELEQLPDLLGTAPRDRNCTSSFLCIFANLGDVVGGDLSANGEDDVEVDVDVEDRELSWSKSVVVPVVECRFSGKMFLRFSNSTFFDVISIVALLSQ